jgi:hypothetical protein
MVFNRTIIGLARLSQEGSRANARIGSQRLRQRRRLIDENPELVSTIVSQAPDIRTAGLALDRIAALADHTSSFRT